MCDLTFTVTGEYIAITDFIFDLEGDDSLRFEINDFVMQKGGQNLQATFIVKNVPIDSKTLSSVPSASNAGYSSSSLRKPIILWKQAKHYRQFQLHQMC